MKTVPLHGDKAAGRVALVDDEDYELVMQYRWFVREEQRSPGHQIVGPYALAHAGHGARNRRTVWMHKLITGYAHTDHIDHDGLNNQRYNLRPVTFSQNQANRRPTARASSAYKGVSWVTARRKWHAGIKVLGKTRHLGTFADEDDAGRAYNAAALEAFGEYAYLNEIPPAAA